MKICSSILALVPAPKVWPIAAALALWLPGSAALAEVSPTATCPPDFTCFSYEPRDGACRHPKIIFDATIKATRNEGDRFSPAYEKACIAQSHASAVRRGLELRLTFGNGSSKAYRDNFSAAACERHIDSCQTYMLYDYFPEQGLFLVHVGYNESQEWFLVRQADGKQQPIIAPPGYSPGRKWLASVYATDGGDDGNNGIDIVPATLDPAEAGFHYRPKDYEQWEFVGWDGDDRLLLKVTARVENGPELVKRPAEVVRVDGKWQLNRHAPDASRP